MQTSAKEFDRCRTRVDRSQLGEPFAAQQSVFALLQVNGQHMRIPANFTPEANMVRMFS